MKPLSRSTHRKGGLSCPPWAPILATNAPLGCANSIPWWFPLRSPSGRAGMLHIPQPHPSLKGFLPCSQDSGKGEANPCLHPPAVNPSHPRGAFFPREEEHGTGRSQGELRPADPGAFPSPVCVTRQTHRQRTNQAQATDPQGGLSPPRPMAPHPPCTPPAFLGDIPVLLGRPRSPRDPRATRGCAALPAELPASLVSSRSGELQGSRNSWMGSPTGHVGGSLVCFCFFFFFLPNNLISHSTEQRNCMETLGIRCVA